MAVFNPRGRDCRYKASVNMPRAFDSGECKRGPDLNFQARVLFLQNSAMEIIIPNVGIEIND